jgi:hypothetical protein
MFGDGASFNQNKRNNNTNNFNMDASQSFNPRQNRPTTNFINPKQMPPANFIPQGQKNNNTNNNNNNNNSYQNSGGQFRFGQ